jgi:putative transposase
MYRLLRQRGETTPRRRQRQHPPYQRPELTASAPNQVWTWDITLLQGPHRGTYYRLYVILDLFSRFVVGWMLAPSLSKVVASAEQASSSRPWGENKN